MSSQKISKEILNARLAHEKWLRRAKHLIENIPVSEDMIPLDPAQCGFGKWFLSEGLKYRSIPILSPILESIDQYHNELHDVYLSIYKIYFVDTKRSWMVSKVTSSYKSVSKDNQELAYKYFLSLEHTSASLMKKLNAFERAVKGINFDNYEEHLA